MLSLLLLLWYIHGMIPGTSIVSHERHSSIWLTLFCSPAYPEGNICLFNCHSLFGHTSGEAVLLKSTKREVQTVHAASAYTHLPPADCTGTVLECNALDISVEKYFFFFLHATLRNLWPKKEMTKNRYLTLLKKTKVWREAWLTRLYKCLHSWFVMWFYNIWSNLACSMLLE